jgi:hypothetical protein
MRREVIPSHKNRSYRILLQQGLQQFGGFFSSLPSSDDYHRFSSMIIHCTQPIMGLWLSRCRDHHLLSFGAPHRSQGGQPTHIKLVSVIEHITCLQIVSGFFNRLF